MRVYSPFGVVLEGRNYTFGSGYRYGFQAQEQDAELWEGAVNYKYRVEDPRLGRFFSVDPLVKNFAWFAPFVYCENRIMDRKELEGAESISVQDDYGDGMVQIELIDWQNLLESDKEILMKKWNVDNEFFKNKQGEFWTVHHGLSSGGFSHGFYWDQYASIQSYKNGKGKPYTKQWTGDLSERLVGFDIDTGSDWKKGCLFGASMVATILSCGALSESLAAYSTLSAALSAEPLAITWSAGMITLDINALTQSPEGTTFLSELFGASEATNYNNWTNATITAVDFSKNLYEISAKLATGEKFNAVVDFTNLVIVTMKGVSDTQTAVEKGEELEKK